MDYEKKYNNALANARQEYNSTENVERKQWLEELFPELVESEDEKIRKALISVLKSDFEKDTTIYDISVGNIIAWLEKQGDNNKLSEEEQNTFAKGVLTSCALSFIDYLDANKYDGKMCVSNGECEDIENAFHNAMWDRLHRYYCKYIEKQGEQPVKHPKFKIGQWIVWQDKCYKVNCNGCGYELIDQNGLSTSLEYETVDESAYPWTIQDTKDGDMLASELCDSIILFKGVENNNIQFYCDYDFSKIDVPGDRFAVNNGQHYGSVDDSEDFHPATKEQRDLLFAKMKEAGYEWDAEKKELKIIDWSKHIKYEPNSPSIIEEKPTWSEEDEHRVKDTIYFLDTAKKHYASTVELDACIDWLKSLKERIGG